MPALDGVRGLAIAAVVAFHYFTSPHTHWVGHALWTVARTGWLGVDLFFALSGFLITGILIDARGSQRYFRDFYIRRTLRIFPLYYGLLTLVFGVLAWLPAFQTASFDALEARQGWLWAYAVNIVNAFSEQPVFFSDVFEANHFWSLAAEEQFYLVWPAVVLLLSERQLVRVGSAIVALTFALIAVFGTDEGALVLLRSGAMVLGGTVASALRVDAWRPIVMRGAPVVFASTSVALVAVALLRGGLHNDDEIVCRIAVPLFATCSMALIVIAANTPADSRLARVLTAAPLVQLGKYSYGLYVIHWAFAPLFDRYVLPVIRTAQTGIGLLDAILVALLKTAIALTVAVAVFHVYEKPFLALKDRWAPTRRG